MYKQDRIIEILDRIEVLYDILDSERSCGKPISSVRNNLRFLFREIEQRNRNCSNDRLRSTEFHVAYYLKTKILCRIGWHFHHKILEIYTYLYLFFNNSYHRLIISVRNVIWKLSSVLLFIILFMNWENFEEVVRVCPLLWEMVVTSLLLTTQTKIIVSKMQWNKTRWCKQIMRNNVKFLMSMQYIQCSRNMKYLFWIFFHFTVSNLWLKN